MAKYTTHLLFIFLRPDFSLTGVRCLLLEAFTADWYFCCNRFTTYTSFGSYIADIINIYNVFKTNKYTLI